MVEIDGTLRCDRVTGRAAERRFSQTSTRPTFDVGAKISSHRKGKRLGMSDSLMQHKPEQMFEVLCDYTPRYWIKPQNSLATKHSCARCLSAMIDSVGGVAMVGRIEGET